MPKKELKHIAVAGNIGAGKTSLSGMLAKHYNWEVHYEDADNNPYLEDFYHSPMKAHLRGRNWPNGSARWCARADAR